MEQSKLGHILTDNPELQNYKTTEQTYRQDLERLKAFRYMDDDFMTTCFKDNFAGVELILKIVLGKKDIKIKSVRTQEVLKNLWGISLH